MYANLPIHFKTVLSKKITYTEQIQNFAMDFRYYITR